jgi:hypothetical protein
MAEILKVTKKTINDICREEEQLDLYNSLVEYLKFLNEAERSAEEKKPMAETIINSYKLREDKNLDEDQE